MAGQLNKTKDKTVEFVQQGKQIIVPEGMSFKDAMEWLQRKHDADEKVVVLSDEITNAFAMDSLVAFSNALKKEFGFTEALDRPGFFGPNPPQFISIKTDWNQSVKVPFGPMAVPGFAGQFNVGVNWKAAVPYLAIMAEAKQREEKKFKRIVSLVREELATNSIYRAKAVKMGWEWLRARRGFNPDIDGPSFLNLSNVTDADLVFPEQIMRNVELGLFAPLEKTSLFRQFGIPLRRGVLLEGPFGTGKTLTALVTARKATKNNWTFIYLNSIYDLEQGLQVAKFYEPAVIFVEDVDKSFAGDRSVESNAVLNLLDGIDTKKNDVICVFTTNSVESLNKAFLRPGRLDTVVPVRPPDAAAAAKLVSLYGRGLLSEDVDLASLGERLNGKIPALIREIVEMAKVAALDRVNGSIYGHVSTKDILDAASMKDQHEELMKETPKNGTPGRVDLTLDLNQLGSMNQQVSKLSGSVEELLSWKRSMD